MKNQEQIQVKVLADSKTKDGIRLTTLRLIYPRFIHAELKTHRMFSTNSSSSRAIPVKSMIEYTLENPAKLCHFGRNQPGMQAETELDNETIQAVEAHWHRGSKLAAEVAEVLNRLGLHKQGTNRVLEPFQHMHTIVSATEFENFFNLRRHKDAQPEIKILADKMWEAIENSVPQILYPGQWHLPGIVQKANSTYISPDGAELTLEQARMVSASLCAQVSYRKEDYSLEKAEKIFNQLIYSEPMHASPVEHQATPIPTGYPFTKGVTHMDFKGNYWSGNFRGWIQFRQLLQQKWDEN